jgi:T5SS/PEP-CTERM-associated repeat protein
MNRRHFAADRWRGKEDRYRVTTRKLAALAVVDHNGVIARRCSVSSSEFKDAYLMDGIKLCARAAMGKKLQVRFVALLLFGGLNCSSASAATTATGDVTPQPITPNSSPTIGNQGIGSVQIDSGSTLTSGSVNIAQSTSAIGTATVTSAGSAWTTSSMNVGNNGLGRLTVSSGAVVSIGGSGLNIGQSNLSTGTVTIQNTGTVLQLTGPLNIGNTGVGLLQIADNAIVNVPNNSTQIGAQFGSTAHQLNRLEFSNGLMRTNFLTNYGVVTGYGELDIFSTSNIQNYGLLESSGGRFVVGGSSSGLIQNNGIISAAGSELEFGRFVSNTSSNGTAAQVTLRDGAIRFPLLNNNQYSLGNDGVLAATGGTDDVYGRINNTSNGTIAATNHSVLTFHHSVTASGGTISVFPGSTAIFLQNLTMSGGALLLADLAGMNDSTGFGCVEVVGSAQLGGASLVVTLSDGFKPKSGDTFPLVAATGAISGTPTLGQMPSLPIGLVWHLNVGVNFVSLSVIPTVTGDYNNGVVDAGDYTVWRDTAGPKRLWPRGRRQPQQRDRLRRLRRVDRQFRHDRRRPRHRRKRHGDDSRAQRVSVVPRRNRLASQLFVAAATKQFGFQPFYPRVRGSAATASRSTRSI